jgi:hypothetical protein
MNYQRIYHQIINRAQAESRKKSSKTYYESHHIFPRCLGGSNKRENLVLLTGREHFIAHWILTRIYPENSKLAFAFWGMSNQKSTGQECRYTGSSRAYEEARELFSKIHSKVHSAFWQTKQGKEARLRVVANTDYAARTANTDYAAMVRNTNYATRANNTDWEERSKKFNKTIHQFKKDGTFVKEWNSIKEAGKHIKIDSTNISNCLAGRQITAGGFIWKNK